MGSFINTFNYKGFDLTLDFQFTWGVDVMQEYYHSTVARFLTNGIDRLYKEAWHPTLNPSGKEQAIRLNNFGQETGYSRVIIFLHHVYPPCKLEV